MLLTIAFCAAAGAHAQDDASAETAAERANELRSEIAMTYDCDIAIHGTPRFDASSNAWLVAYSAVGEECDAAAIELMARGQDLGASFYRRPSAGQANALMRRIADSVSRAFHCQITMLGTPRFDEQSAYWSAGYSAFGSDCNEAGQELRRRGREFQIVFNPIRTGPSLVR